MRGTEHIHALVDRLTTERSIDQAELSSEEITELESYGFTAEQGIVAVPDETALLTKERILNQLHLPTSAWLRQLDIVPAIDSTNTALSTRAQSESIDGHVLIAELQTQGKGRRGRKWLSPFARNVMLSTGFQLVAPTSNIGSISLAMGVAVANALEGVADVSVQLKWPNDIYLNDRKLGGILIDLLQAGPPVKLLLGIGINVRAAPEQLESPNAPAIALADVVPDVSRHEVVSALLNELVATIGQYTDEGFQSFVADWSSRDVFAGQFLYVDGLNEEIEGWNRGIDTSGALQLETSKGLRKIIGGDVTIRRK